MYGCVKYNSHEPISASGMLSGASNKMKCCESQLTVLILRKIYILQFTYKLPTCVAHNDVSGSHAPRPVHTEPGGRPIGELQPDALYDQTPEVLIEDASQVTTRWSEHRPFHPEQPHQIAEDGGRQFV